MLSCLEPPELSPTAYQYQTVMDYQTAVQELDDFRDGLRTIVELLHQNEEHQAQRVAKDVLQDVTTFLNQCNEDEPEG